MIGLYNTVISFRDFLLNNLILYNIDFFSYKHF